MRSHDRSPPRDGDDRRPHAGRHIETLSNSASSTQGSEQYPLFGISLKLANDMESAHRIDDSFRSLEFWREPKVGPVQERSQLLRAKRSLRASRSITASRELLHDRI